jgi:hypothetical protein
LLVGQVRQRHFLALNGLHRPPIQSVKKISRIACRSPQAMMVDLAI